MICENCRTEMEMFDRILLRLGLVGGEIGL